MRPRQLTIVLATLAACVAALPAAAQADEASVSMHPSFLPNRLGASTVFTLAFRFSGGELGIAPALHQVAVQLPAELRINVAGVKICPLASLKRKGPKGCPASSLVGRGHALLQVHAGSQAVPEEANLSIFRGPDREGLATFEIFGQGETPLYQSAVSTEILETAKAPYGWRTVTTVPPIPTVMYEPNASFTSVSLTVGGIRRSPRAHAAAGAILEPHHCPSGGFPFTANVSFANGETASTTATIPCP
jgi:hypothetical protein